MKPIRYHKDGTVTMDFYTFCKLPRRKIMETLAANARTVRIPTKQKRTPRPRASVGKLVKEYA